MCGMCVCVCVGGGGEGQCGASMYAFVRVHLVCACMHAGTHMIKSVAGGRGCGRHGAAPQNFLSTSLVTARDLTMLPSVTVKLGLPVMTCILEMSC